MSKSEPRICRSHVRRRWLVPCVGLAIWFSLVGVSPAQQQCTQPTTEGTANNTILVGDCEHESGCSYKFKLYEHGKVRLSNENSPVDFKGCQGTPVSAALLSYQAKDEIRPAGGSITVSQGRLYVDSIDVDCSINSGRGVTFRFECGKN